jgi:DNA-binding MarR family transcriptional regulator
LRCSHGVVSVGHDAAPIRRDLGPLAWIVLEELVLCADEGEDGELRSALGVRELASALGISKDTAARALRRLIEARLARRITSRSAEGRFASCHYVLRLPRGLSLRGEGVPAAKLPAPAIPRRRAAASRSRRAHQLTLIDHAAEGDG